MGACRALFLAGIFLMLASVPARAQEEPGGQSEPRAVTEAEQRILDDVTETSDRPWTEGISLEKRQRAYELFLEGNDDIREGFFGNAADKYKEALALWPHPAFHYNLGIAQMNLAQPIEAHDRFLAARKNGPMPLTDEKYQLAQKYLDALRKQLGEIEVICNEPGAEVAVGGKPIFTGPGRQRVMVRPGGHRVEASKRRFIPGVEQVVLNPGDRKRVTVAPQLPEHLATTRRWPQWIPWAVAGAGAVILAGASAMDWHSTNLFRQFDSDFTMRCPGVTDGCPREEIPVELNARLDGAHAWQRAAAASYVAGGLIVATSAALLYLNRERIVHERRLDGDVLSLTPMLMPDGAGMSAGIRF